MQTVDLNGIDQVKALGPAMAELEGRAASLGASFTRAFAAAATGAKGLDEVLRGMALRVSSLALSAALKPVDDLFGKALGALTAGATGTAAGAAGAAVKPFASGGVVAAPTYFASASGLGLMGEAGAEAILPLRRGADGALGVAMAGDGARGQPSIVFNVTASDAESFRRSEAQISAMLARATRRGLRGL